MNNLVTSCYSYDIRESIHNFNFGSWVWNDERLTLKVFYWLIFFFNTCIGHHTVLKVIPIRQTGLGTLPTSIRRVFLADHGG
jgi:hypothetical protein